MTTIEKRIKDASTYASQEFIEEHSAYEWCDDEQDWIRAIFETGFVKGAIWERQTDHAIKTTPKILQ